MRRLVKSFLSVAVLCGLVASGHAAPRPGGDADAHGCRGSAGYSWCPRTKQCERPWELAKARGFKSSPAAFKRFCRLR